jgi:23S rRNA (cytosine1962-C5)-methyltransferase
MRHFNVKIYLKAGKDEPVRRRHPWVFSGAIARMEGQPTDGDLVSVFSKQGDWLGHGHFHHGSIAVRLIALEESADPSSPAFWEDRIRQAWQVRQLSGLGGAHTNAFRLIHGEGDGLSGLIVDVYGTTSVVQCHSIGMHRQRELIQGAICAVLSERITQVYDKSVESLPPQYAEMVQNGPLWLGGEAAESMIVQENGVRFSVNWVTGQKTGFFLDQRDNRALLGQYAADKTVLNAFCYSGGFSCYALRAGARSVHSLDISPKAMLLTDENVALNEHADRHTSITADVLQYLKLENGEIFDIVVIDPPAFAKSLEKRHNAVQAYKRLNAMALQRVAPGGLLFTFSCSQVVDRQLFYHTVAAAAMEVGREVRVLHHLTQGADHPVSLFHPEGSYLKGLVLQVV